MPLEEIIINPDLQMKKGDAQTREGIYSKPSPDLTESPSWALAPVRTASQGGKGPHPEDLRQAGGQGYSRGPCGRGKDTVSWEHSQLDRFEWEAR